VTDSPSAPHDVVVVGAGHHGLTAATLLARAGLSVVVLDRLDRPGGAAATWQPFAGRGARVSAYAGPVPPFPAGLLDELEVHLETVTPPPPPSAPREPVEALRELAEAVEATLLGPLPSARDLPTAPTLTGPLSGLAALDALASSSLPEPVVGPVVGPALLRHALAGGADRWPQVVGGGGAVAGALADVATRAGAELRLGGGVAAIRPGPGDAAPEVDVDFPDGRRSISARFVLADVAPWILDILLGGEDDPATKPQGSRFVVDLLVDRLPDALTERLRTHGRVAVHADPDALAAAYDDARQGLLPRRPPGALHSPSLLDPSLVADEPDGTHTLTWVGVHHPVHLFDPDPEARRAEALGHVLEALEPHGLGDDVLARDADGRPCVRARSPLDLEAEFAAPGGHPFHGDLDWPWAPSRARLDTPELAWGVATGHPRVLLAGSGARRGGTLSGVAGHDAAQAVLASR
jgi:phytoene dehydrogenase-like protein